MLGSNGLGRNGIRAKVHYLWAVICYFCDTADPESAKAYSKYYVDNPLWDGEGCVPQSSCCEFNHPPWFCTSLSTKYYR